MGRREPQLPCSYRALGSLVGQAVPGLGPMDDPRRDKLRIQQHIPQLSVESESIFVALGMVAPGSKLRTLVMGNVGHDFVC